jgi:hypothetical protein
MRRFGLRLRLHDGAPPAAGTLAMIARDPVGLVENRSGAANDVAAVSSGGQPAEIRDTALTYLR